MIRAPQLIRVDEGSRQRQCAAGADVDDELTAHGVAVRQPNARLDDRMIVGERDRETRAGSRVDEPRRIEEAQLLPDVVDRDDVVFDEVVPEDAVDRVSFARRQSAQVERAPTGTERRVPSSVIEPSVTPAPSIVPDTRAAPGEMRAELNAGAARDGHIEKALSGAGIENELQLAVAGADLHVHVIAETSIGTWMRIRDAGLRRCVHAGAGDDAARRRDSAIAIMMSMNEGTLDGFSGRRHGWPRIASVETSIQSAGHVK